MMINLFALTKLPTKRRQRIIVAEFQFIHRDGVVLVNDRDDAALQQLVDRHQRVLHALAVREVVPGEQNLRHANAVGRKRFVVRLHEKRLADSCGGLFLVQHLGPRAVAKGGEACGHCAGGNEQHLMTVLLQLRQLRRKKTYFIRIQAARI